MLACLAMGLVVVVPSTWQIYKQSATEDSFESNFSANNQCISSMIFIETTLFPVEEYTHRHTHLTNTFYYSLVCRQILDAPPASMFVSQQASGNERGCENVAGHEGHRRR